MKNKFLVSDLQNVKCICGPFLIGPSCVQSIRKNNWIALTEIDIKEES